MAEDYQTMGYGSGSVGVGKRAAMLVVDWQRGFTDPLFPLGGSPRLHRARDATAELLARARACNVPVALAYIAYSSEREMPLWKIPSTAQFRHGEDMAQLDPAVVAPGDFIFSKSAPSMFFNTPLMTFLTRAGVDTVFITGCTTSGCVRATVVDAFSHGFHVQLVEDCCGDPEEQAHLDTLRDCERRYCDVLNSVETRAILTELQTDSV